MFYLEEHTEMLKTATAAIGTIRVEGRTIRYLGCGGWGGFGRNMDKNCRRKCKKNMFVDRIDEIYVDKNKPTNRTVQNRE